MPMNKHGYDKNYKKDASGYAYKSAPFKKNSKQKGAKGSGEMHPNKGMDPAKSY